VGGSVPVCELFQNILGVYTVGFGFALDDERFHAPDEFYRLQSFYRGQEGYCRLLHRLGRG
jgi:acetylornithine deacetylase/succinyl-diaminopimelate desuccinylase-like protein